MLGDRARPSPAGREPRQEPAGDVRHPRQPPPGRHPHRLRPGRVPARRPRHASHARSTGAQPPTWPSQRRSTALELPSNGPPALRSGPIGSIQVRRCPCRRPLGPAVTLASPRHARADCLRDPRHPPPPPPLSSRPPAARADPRPRARRPGFGVRGPDWDFELKNRDEGLPGQGSQSQAEAQLHGPALDYDLLQVHSPTVTTMLPSRYWVW